VLDLTGAARATDFRRADEVVCGLEAADDRPGSFDTAVSVLWLSGTADTAEALARVSRSLAPKGELVFLEPVREPGIGRHGQGLVSPVLQRTTGWRVDRDIPALLRDAGWSITDLERIPVPRYLWPLHGLVEGRAHLRVRSAS
jgi:SAM-dependent methyltransferase